MIYECICRCLFDIVILVEEDEVYRNRLGPEEYFGSTRGQYRALLDPVIGTHF
jgi:hypothetical protein